MTEKYDPKTIEAAIQARWEQTGAHCADDHAEARYYCLSMFPYPSGKLHMGHVRNYAIADAITRYLRMQGISVLQPMGWDAFGLPAENAALQQGLPPAQWTMANIDHMRDQLKALGFAIDWSRELATCQPEYYRWNQWFFLRLLEKGIAYKKTGTVNWDPVDHTVLANEQVIEGRGWRTGAVVEKREIPMYYLRISDYAQELLDDLERLDGWPERVRTMQANWIGRSAGVEIHFPCDGDVLKVFTTRADTLMGATYLAVAAEHPLATRAAADNPALQAFIEECKRGPATEAQIATQEKRGMATGRYAEHPLTGEALPVWVANYVLMGYGEGAVMAVPAHDQRDFEFASQNGLPILPVIAPPQWQDQNLKRSTVCAQAGDRAGGPQAPMLSVAGESALIWDEWREVFAQHGILCYSGKYDGLASLEAIDAIADDLEAKGLGKKRVQFRLRDWGISRQRYWGCPIPIIHCPSCGDVPVPDEDLPVLLPDDLVPDGTGSPLARCAAFIDCRCPECGAAARRETDTMDTFVDSSWYFMRYACHDNDQAMVDERVRRWLPVNQYIGGIEHAILHLLYARFWTRLMRDCGLVEIDEPFTHLLTQGMVIAETWYREGEQGRRAWFNPADIETERDEKGQLVRAWLKADGQPVQFGGIEKMSKSRNNGVDPQTLIDRYGADTARLFILFAAPPEHSLEWSDDGVEGAWRFLRRLWQNITGHVQRGAVPGARPTTLDGPARELRCRLHETIAKVSDDMGRRHTFNTAIAAVMEFVNHLSRFTPADDAQAALCQEGWEAVVRLIAPITPHISEALWTRLGHSGSVFSAGWPEIDETALARDSLPLVVQVNGKVRGRIAVAPGSSQEIVMEAARNDPNVARWLDGQSIRKVILVPDKLLNIVL